MIRTVDDYFDLSTGPVTIQAPGLHLVAAAEHQQQQQHQQPERNLTSHHN